ncbi:MAG: PEP-CTERM sorting domain-containing protein, partial [Pirellulales bacterium]|nr:PEP-CTERM sorting domain-containing protein [Pirellulales bacterium]
GDSPVGQANVTLVKGSLTDIELEVLGGGGGVNFQFLADVDENHPSVPSFGAIAGIKVNSLQSGFDFMSPNPYASAGSTADIGRPVPEPATLAAFACTLGLGCTGLRRRRRKQAA